jgi:hypothetical protein
MLVQVAEFTVVHTINHLPNIDILSSDERLIV